MADRSDALAIAGQLRGTLRDLFTSMAFAPGGFDALQVELDRFTFGNTPGNADTARLVALAMVRRRRLAFVGDLRDRADDYLIAMARGRVPPPKPPNDISNVVHVSGDPYDDWSGLVKRHDRISPTGKSALGDALFATSQAVSWRQFARIVSEARRLTPGAYLEHFGRKLVSELGKTVVGWLWNSASSSMLGAVSRPSADFLDTATERSTDWAAQYAGRLITDISSEQEKTFRELVTGAFTDGVGPEELAWRLRTNGLGLHTRYSNAVDNFYRGMVEEGTSRGVARDRAGKYAAHLRDVRADTIARTETMYALNWGRMELWNAAVQHEDLAGSETGKRWVTALDERVCPICRPMNNIIVGLYQHFELPGRALSPSQRGKVFLPPAHPNCRCTMVLYQPNEGRLPAVQARAA